MAEKKSASVGNSLPRYFSGDRALLYYQALFPETRILVTPTVTQGIRREDWFGRPKTIDLVLQEVEHCGSQFHEILKKYPEPAIPVR